MSMTVQTCDETAVSYLGLRMSAEEFLSLPEDTCRYELVDGVVIVSPSSTPKHQLVLAEILRQLGNYVAEHDVGMVIPDIDVHLGRGLGGRDLVYRPDVIFVGRARLDQVGERVRGAPDLAVEVVSPGSRRFDRETKKGDYERCGVGEYWLVDPRNETMTFYRLTEGRYVEVEPSGQSFASEAVPGFVLDLARVRQVFKAWK